MPARAVSRATPSRQHAMMTVMTTSVAGCIPGGGMNSCQELMMPLSKARVAVVKSCERQRNWVAGALELVQSTWAYGGHERGAHLGHKATW